PRAVAEKTASPLVITTCFCSGDITDMGLIASLSTCLGTRRISLVRSFEACTLGKPALPSKIIKGDEVAVTPVSQQGESQRVNGVVNKADRTISEQGIDPPGMGRAKPCFQIPIGPAEIGGGSDVGSADDILVPAAGVALVVIRLTLAEIGEVEAFFAYQ